MKFAFVCISCLAIACLATKTSAIPPLGAVDECHRSSCADGACTNGCCSTACQQLPPNPIAPGRPSPPPCCADGISLANPDAWGFYPTRWRRWSIEYAAVAPPGTTAPSGTLPEMRPYETPSAEEEDLQAPEPTVPREEPIENGGLQQPGPQTPTGTQPAPAGPGAAPAPSGGGGPLRNLPAYEPQSPGLRSPDTGSPQTPSSQPSGTQAPATRPLSSGIPTSDLDPPPALPIGTRSLNERTIERSARVPATIAPQQPARAARQAPSTDPPPALPTSLASLGG